MNDHGRIKKVSNLLCVLYFSYYYHKTSTAVFFHGKYRRGNFEYRPSLVHTYILRSKVTTDMWGHLVFVWCVVWVG